MSDISMLVLICSTALSHAECLPKTAVDVVRGPQVDNLVMCSLNAQMMIAQTNLARGDVYMKVMCAPTMNTSEWAAEIDARKAAVERVASLSVVPSATTHRPH